MMSITELILLMFFGILDSGVSFILNMCILVKSAQSLRAGLKLNPPDLIHIVIGLVNIALQGLLVAQSLVFFFWISLLFMKKFYIPVIVSTLTLMYFTYWLTAWLCIYYCVTICNFNHPIFLWSKRNISMYLPHLLILSGASCFLISLPTIWTVRVNIILHYSVNSTRAPIFTNGTFHFPSFYIQTASLIGCCLPFWFIFASILVTVSSLLKHLAKMRQKESELSQVKDLPHINAIRTMCQFLVISIIFYLSEVLFFSVNPNPEDTFTSVNWMIFMTFPTAESFIIISANPKLRKLFMVKLWCFHRKL